MKSKLGHLQINIQFKNINFYKGFFAFMGWKLLYEDVNICGVGVENGTSVWFEERLKDVQNDYDGIGMNHFAISVERQSEVDEVVAYLNQQNIPTLFNTPCHRTEFSGPNNTYYQVMFETPDKILFEVVYTGPKDK